jgi:hypothetical protein
MTPQPGQQITIYFRTGVRIDGEVVSWTNKQYTLQTANGTATIVIPNGKQDILFYKISTTKTVFEKLKNKPQKTKNDIKTLAQLKNEMNVVERESISDRLISNEPNSIKVPYDTNSTTIPSSFYRSRKETNGTDPKFGSELQDLFGKKYQDH